MSDLKQGVAGSAERRRDPLPDGVRMVYLEHRAAALWLRAPGQAALRTQRDGPWQELTIRGVRRYLRPWMVRVRLADGTRLKLRLILPGKAGLADCGRDQGGPEGFWPDDLGGADDPFSAVLVALAWLLTLLLLPWVSWNNARRCAHAHRLVRALKPR